MAFQLAPYLAESLPGIGIFGSLVGGAAALAKNAKLLRDGKVGQRDAVIDIGKETVGAGLATAFSAGAAGAVGGGLVVSIGVAVAAGLAGKYAWDRCAEYAEEQWACRETSSVADDELLQELK